MVCKLQPNVCVSVWVGAAMGTGMEQYYATLGKTAQQASMGVPVYGIWTRIIAFCVLEVCLEIVFIL